MNLSEKEIEDLIWRYKGGEFHGALPQTWKDRVEDLEKECEVAADLIEKLMQYNEFLGDEMGPLAGFAATHGWKCSEDVYNKGVRFREDIKELIDKWDNTVHF